MKICDIMNDRVVSIEPDEPVTAAAKLLARCNVGSLPVCSSGGRLLGIVTDRDIVMRCVALGGDASSMKVRDVMSLGPAVVSPFDDVKRAAEVMANDQVRRLPVMNDGKLVGVVTLCDMARSCGCEMEAAEALSEISSSFHRR